MAGGRWNFDPIFDGLQINISIDKETRRYTISLVRDGEETAKVNDLTEDDVFYTEIGSLLDHE